MNREKIFKKLKSLSVENQVKTALFTAELVSPIYESYFPEDNRVRNAIAAGKQCDTAYTAHAARAARAAARAAAYVAARAARAAAYVAVRHGLTAGAKKQTVYEFMERLSAS